MTDLTFNIVALGNAFTKMIALGDSVERLGLKLDELSRKVATPKIDVDTTAANAKIDELNRKINSTQGLSGGVNNLQTALIGLGAALGAGALSGAALATIPAAITAVGVAAVHSNVDVQNSFSDMTSAAKTSLTQGFAPFVPTLVAIAGQGKTAFAGLTPVFAEAAAATAPLLQSVSTGLIKAATDGVASTVPLLQGLGPVAQAIGDDFVKVEHGVAGLLGNLDVSGAANGLSILGTDIEQLLPAVGSLIAEVTPLANALLADLGPALTSAAHDLLILTPILNAAGAVVSFLGPDISMLGPPLLAVMGITKLMTGSWLAFGVAADKVRPGLVGMGGTLDTLRQKLGYTSAATNQATAARAAETYSAAEAAVAEQRLAVAQAEAAFSADSSEKNAIALVAAQDALAASAAVAAKAETALAATSEVATFSFGPLGIALGVAALLMLPFITSSHDAATSTQDLTTGLVQLGQAAPGAAGGILSGNQSLSDLINKAGTAGINVKGLIDAYGKGPQALQTFTDGVNRQHDALGNQQVTVDAFTESLATNGDVNTAAAMSVKDLTNFVNGNKTAYDNLSPSLKALVDQYNAQNNIQGQLGTSVKELTGQQDAQKAAMASSTDTQKQAASVANALGLNIDSVTMAFAGLASGTKYAMTATQQMSDTFLTQTLAVYSANATVTNYFKQTDQAAQQASVSLVDANHSYAQSVIAVGDAQHAAAQADQAVATARQGVMTAQRSVTDALANEVTAENNVTKAQVARTQAQVNLNTATQQAVEQLKALHLQMADQVTSEESARIALFDQLAVSKGLGVTPDNAAALAATPLTDVNVADEAKIKSAIDLLKAEQALNGTLNTGANLRDQVTAADKAGVAGSQGVLSAQQALASAQDQVASSQQALIKSQQAVTDAQANVIKAEQGVTDALYNERKARQAVADAMYNEQKAGQAVAAAQVAMQTARDNDSHSMDIHTAAGQRNFAMLQQIAHQLIANEDPQQAGNDLINQAAGLFNISTGAAQAYLTQLGLIPTNFKFGLTAVAAADFSQLNASYATIIARGVNATAGLPVPHATGGAIGGIGGPTEDANLIWASTGEFMQPASAHDYYGTPFMEAIRHKQIPKEAIHGFATGGTVGDLSNALGMGALGDLYQTAANTYSVLGVPSPPAPKSLPKYVAPVIPNVGGGSLAVSGATAAAAQAYAFSRLGAYGWGPDQMPPLIKLWNEESGWNPNAVNASSGAYGIPQALGHGHPYNLGDYVAQIDWGDSYIKGRYGSPAAAWAFETSHTPNWYRDGGPVVEALRRPKVRDHGGPIDPGWNMIFNGTGRAETSRSGAQEDALLAELRELRRVVSNLAPVNVNPAAGAPIQEIVAAVERSRRFKGR